MGLASCGATVTLSHHVRGRCVGGLRVTLLTSYCRRWLILKSAITLLRLYVTTICVMDYIWIVIWTWVTSTRLRETLSQWRSVNGVSSYSRRLWKLTPWCGLWKLTPWCMWTVKTDPMMYVDCENWPHDVCGLWKLTPWCGLWKLTPWCGLRKLTPWWGQDLRHVVDRSTAILATDDHQGTMETITVANMSH